ncbi:MAG: Helix-turn-helix type 11 domain-containing protein [bacterium]|nr:MAG: Helix-turn-helix type 11 domain-containing protein [bacterium]KAF0150733.1 MAG: Helix-turn-helix type 11 domain-containing protein [bacterium]KAF0169586.1 MAG: Helix-turn-helix type 11 domain-containing protein [bacterium]TXT22514.1 MAG: Helix-turn-helix type 11 domain-containing protein [bacterium]
MDRTERFHIIDSMLAGPGLVTFQRMLERLEVSRATLKRDLEYLRNRLNAPIVWDRDTGGYRYEKQERVGGQFELPGLWFSAEEIHALLTMQHLLANLDAGGLLGAHIQPLMARITGLLGSGRHPAEEVRKRIRLIPLAARQVSLEHFAALGSALLRRKRLYIRYYAKSGDATSEREVSPQRLVHYRENWYLDAWCHLREGLRSFAVDGVRRAEILESHARDVPEKTLDAVLGSGYGIFSGRKVSWARLRFGPERSRWVALEQWHPKQRGKLGRDGRYLLEIPYADDRELVMDILRHVPEVEVLAPAALRETVLAKLREGLARMA